MDQEIRWFELRIKLLQTHLQEQYQRIIDQRETKCLLEVEHQKEKDQALSSIQLPTALEWLALMTRQTAEIKELAKAHSQSSGSLFTRQQQELIFFTELIKQQKRLTH